MKNTKKVLSVALAGALAFGSMGAAFAAAPLTEGIDNKDVVKAVEKLSAFGIVNGMEDGKYHAEGELTRAQFSKMLVEALGLGSAVQSNTNKPNFSDVDESSKWAWGYINVAQGQGLLSGYPDGTFKPGEKVSYAEALTMLVRALGYKDSFLKGTWPGNYMAKAADLDITDNVVLEGGVVNRGNAAVLVSNTLDANIIKQDTFGDENNWVEDKYTTLIEDKLDIEKYEDAQVIAIPRVEGGVDKDQIKISYKDEDNKTQEKTYDVKENISTDNLLGEGINVYYDTTDKEIVYVETADKEFKTYYDVVDEDEDINDDEFTIINADKALNVDEDAQYYIDNKPAKFSEFKSEAEKGNLFVKAVANEKGNITIVDAQKWEKNGVIAVKADANQLTYFDQDEDTRELKAKDYDKVVVIDNTGKTMKLEDIKENDVVYVNDKNIKGEDLELASSKDEIVQLVVVRNAVKGKGQSWSDEEFEIDSKDYDVAKNATVSADKGKKVEAYGDSDNELDDITAEDAEVMALLDLKGDIRHLTTDVKASSNDLFGIITGTDGRYEDVAIKVLNPEGKEVEYELDVDDEDFVGYTNASDVETNGKFDMIKYTINKDGKIDTIEKIKSVADDGTIPTGIAGTGKDITKNSIVLADGTHVVEDDVVVFDYTAAYSNGKIADAEDAEIVKWEDLYDKSLDSNTQVVYATNDDNEIEALFFVKDFDLVDDDTLTGYVLAIKTIDGDKYADIHVPGTDKAKRYELDSDLAKDVADKKIVEDSVISFVEASNGKIKRATSNDVIEYTGKVTDIAGKTIKLQTQALAATPKVETLRLDSSAVYYETDDVMSYSDLDDNDYVTVVADKGIVKVVKLYDTEDDSKEVTKFLGKTSESSDTMADWNKVNGDSGSTPTPTTPSSKVTYINAQGNMIVGDETYAISDTTILKDDAGTVLAVGKTAIAGKINVNDTVNNIVVENGVVKSLVRVSTDAEKAAAFDALVTAFSTPATQAEVTAARTAYDKLTTAQKALVTPAKLTTLQTEEAKLIAVVVDAKLAALPAEADVTLADKADITAARTEYNKLTPAQASQLTAANVTKLTDAEGAIVDLEAAKADVDAAKAALIATTIFDGTDSIELPADTADVTYTISIGTLPTLTTGSVTGTGVNGTPAVIVKDAEGFTFEVTVTITAVNDATAVDETTVKTTKVFVVTVPNTVAPITVTVK